MTSRIPSARDSNGNPVTIEMAQQQHYENLICANCPAPVGFVNGSMRRLQGDGIGVVEPYFRLKAGSSHSGTCDFHIKCEIAEIVRKSKRAVVREREHGGYEFDLLVVRDALRAWQSPAVSAEKHKSERSSRTHAHNGRQTLSVADREALKPYINDAMKVLKLRARCGSNTEMQAALVLRFREHRISWSEFYYEHKNYFRCVDYVSRTAEQLPIAVRGWIQHIGPVWNGPDKGKTALHLAGKYRPTDLAHVQEVADFSIYARHPKAFEKYAQEQEILTLGLWDLCEVEDSPNKKAHHPIRTFRKHKLRLDLVLPVQICAATVVSRRIAGQLGASISQPGSSRSVSSASGRGVP